MRLSWKKTSKSKGSATLLYVFFASITNPIMKLHQSTAQWVKSSKIIQKNKNPIKNIKSNILISKKIQKIQKKIQNNPKFSKTIPKYSTLITISKAVAKKTSNT
jgi:hypothetical protein